LRLSTEPASYTKYGLTYGSLTFLPKYSLIILSKTWPSWAFGVSSAGFQLRCVVLLDPAWTVMCLKFLPRDQILLYKDFVKDVHCHWTADVIVSDIDPPVVFNLWGRVNYIYVGRQGVRHHQSIPSGFNYHFLSTSHVESGGVTDGHWTLRFYLNSNISWYPSNFPSLACRDLSSIINSTVSHGLPCPPPPPLTNLAVHQLRPNTFHGGGLFPFAHRTSYFVVPSIFTISRWARRHLTAEETLLALDVSDVQIKELSSAERKMLCNDTFFLPGKTTTTILQFLATSIDQQTSPPLPVACCPLEDKDSSVDMFSSNLSDLPLSLPPTVPDNRILHTLKSVKADNAEVPVYLWNDRIWPETPAHVQNALDTLRRWRLRLWRVDRKNDFLKWFVSHHGVSPSDDRTRFSFTAIRDLHAGKDCLRRCMGATWWEWSAGSRPHFWRWPVNYQAAIRDGIPIWFKGPVTMWRRPQSQITDPQIQTAVRQKLSQVRAKGYVEKGDVFSLTSFFAVPKGPTDIRMVYDGTKSGLNATLWAPWFPLPTVETHLRATLPGYFMADVDIGEMFLNFIMHESVRQYCGIDLTLIFPEELRPGQVLWERWGRCGMGFVFSPYQSIQGMLWAEELIMGNRFDPSNPFRFAVVVLNLPGSPTYNPALPWVSKRRTSNGPLACDLFIYVDDCRTLGPSEQDCWLASQRVARVLNFLGLQDATRKRRGPSLEPGPWAGSIVYTSHGSVTVQISQERWDKLKIILLWIKDQLLHQSNGIEHKQLEQHRGVLVYISRTYPAITPYLKGIHLTLDSWRPWRKSDGWKMTMRELKEYLQEKHNSTLPVDSHANSKPPSRVKPVPRLACDIEALLQLTSGPLPIKRSVRPTSTTVALYGFADASGHGFGSTLVINGTVHFRHGQWSSSYDDSTSNFRELDNLITAIEEAAMSGLLANCELFMFTDNSTAESAFYKGTSSSYRLFTLVLRLRCLQMNGTFTLHVIHVAGSRMISEGTDGLSRGDLSAGVMLGTNILTYVPLHQDALARDPSLVAWVQSWYPDHHPNWLSPDAWYDQGQTCNHCIWTPPPAAADAALELLARSKHKRPYHQHIMLIPRLLTSHWRKLLSKVCDLVFTVPVGTDVWPRSHHEPLLVGIAFPLIIHRPWRLRGSKLMDSADRDLRHLQTTTPQWGGTLLRELFLCTGGLDQLSEGVVWSMLHGGASR
jgi:hypothetical protein